MIIIMQSVLSLFDGERVKRFDPGDTIFRTGAAVRQVFLVRKGRTVLTRPLPSGEQTILQRASCGHIIAEASVYAQYYHCDCMALEQTELSHMSSKSFLKVLRSTPHVSEAWASYLAHGIQQARMRAEIRSMKTVAERLSAWMAEYGKLPEKGQWQGLADELSVSREALYRELARRRSA